MGNTRDQVGKAGLFVAGGIFRTAFYVCVAVLIFWIGKSAYQFGYNVFNQQAVSPGAGQEVTVVIPEGSSTYDVAKILKSKGLIDDSLVFFAQEKLSTYKGQMQAGTYLLSTAYTPTRIMGILAGDEEQTGVTQDSATAADTAAQQILRLQMQELIQLIPRVQMVQQILRQLMELQGKESPDSDRRGENAHLHQFS